MAYRQVRGRTPRASSVGQESAKKPPAWRVNNAPRTAILARALRSSLCAPVFMGLGSAILPFNGRETAATRRHGLPGHGSSLLRCGFAVLSFLASNFPQRYQGDFTQPCIFGTEFTCTGVEFTPALLGPSEPGWYRIHPTHLHSPEAQASDTQVIRARHFSAMLRSRLLSIVMIVCVEHECT